MGSCKHVFIWFEHYWLKGWDHTGKGHTGLSPPQGRKWLKQQAKDKHQVFIELKKLFITHSLPRREWWWTDVSFAIIPKDVNYANEPLIRVLKKEPHIFGVLDVHNQECLLTLPPGSHCWCQAHHRGLLFSVYHLESWRGVLWGVLSNCGTLELNVIF